MPFNPALQFYPCAGTEGKGNECSSLPGGRELAAGRCRSYEWDIRSPFPLFLYPRFTHDQLYISQSHYSSPKSTWWLLRICSPTEPGASDCRIWTVVLAPTGTQRQRQGGQYHRGTSIVYLFSLSKIHVAGTYKYTVLLLLQCRIDGRPATADCVLIGVYWNGEGAVTRSSWQRRQPKVYLRVLEDGHTS